MVADAILCVLGVEIAVTVKEKGVLGPPPLIGSGGESLPQGGEAVADAVSQGTDKKDAPPGSPLPRVVVEGVIGNGGDETVTRGAAEKRV